MKTSITFNCEELLKKFDLLNLNHDQINKKILRAILRPIKNEVRKNLRGRVLKKRTGTLAEHTDIFVSKDGKVGWLGTTETARSPRNAWWIHAANTEGYIINPKKKSFLIFNGNKGWIRKKSIFVKARPTVLPVWKERASDSSMAAIAEGTLKKEFEKWAKK